MDPITTAILAALSAFATKRAGEALEGAYSTLVTAIRRKFGANSNLLQAVQAVEEDPKDDELRNWLKEEIDAAGAARDAKIKNAAEHVIEEVRGLRGGQRIIRVAQDGGVIIEGNVHVDHGSTFAGRDIITDQSRNTYTSEPSAYIPQTPIGWILGIPALICILAGFLVFFFSLGDAMGSSSGPSDETFSDAGFAFKLIIVGFVVGAIATGIDKTLGSRRKK
jgi:hypothetical protein